MEEKMKIKSSFLQLVGGYIGIYNSFFYYLYHISFALSKHLIHSFLSEYDPNLHF